MYTLIHVVKNDSKIFLKVFPGELYGEYDIYLSLKV